MARAGLYTVFRPTNPVLSQSFNRCFIAMRTRVSTRTFYILSSTLIKHQACQLKVLPATENEQLVFTSVSHHINCILHAFIERVRQSIAMLLLTIFIGWLDQQAPVGIRIWAAQYGIQYSYHWCCDSITDIDRPTWTRQTLSNCLEHEVSTKSIIH
jgi:hypothetical protein